MVLEPLAFSTTRQRVFDLSILLTTRRRVVLTRRHNPASHISYQARNRLAVVDVMRAIEFVVPCGGIGNSKSVIDRGCHILGLLRIAGGIGGNFVG